MASLVIVVSAVLVLLCGRTDRQTRRQTRRQTDRQTDTQTDVDNRFTPTTDAGVINKSIYNVLI